MNFTKDPLPSLFKKIAIPAIIATLFQTLFNVVDTFLLEKFLPKLCPLLLNLFRSILY